MLLGRPAVAEVYLADQKVAEVVGTTEDQTGADRGRYPVAVLKVIRPESE